MSRWTHDGSGWRARADDATVMRRLGAEVGRILKAGDLVVLDGALGAGKTTFVQGLAGGLDVRGPITSPTFVIARRHPGPRVALVHVDAYRIGSGLDVDDLDLDADVAECVTVVEWGVGKVEGLGESRLEITIDRTAVPGPSAAANPADEFATDPAAGPREVTVRPVGDRWLGLLLPQE